ncbi:hypothetical protein [Pelotalea chapellei]|nr:hypothetical protein [Pelotalea chapellei]
MVTMTTILVLVMLAAVITPWIGSMYEHHGSHRTDLMAGDEGED